MTHFHDWKREHAKFYRAKSSGGNIDGSRENALLSNFITEISLIKIYQLINGQPN